MPAPRRHFATITALLTERGEMRSRDLAEAAGLNVGTLKAALASPVRDGEIVKRVDGRAVYYSIGDGTPPAANDADTDAEHAGGTEEEVEEAPKFNAALWADGELVLVGVDLNADGRSVTLSAEQTRLVCRLLHGQGPES